MAALLMPVLFLTGCAMVVIPVPADKRAAISGHVIDKADIGFIAIGVTTRDEVVHRLGQNFRTSQSKAAISYSWERKGGDLYYAAILTDMRTNGAMGAGKDSRTWSYWRGLFVDFDEHDRVRRFEFVKLNQNRSVDDQRNEWAAKRNLKR